MASPRGAMDAWDALNALAESMSPMIARAFYAAVGNVRRGVVTSSLERALDRGNLDEAVTLLLGVASDDYTIWASLAGAKRSAVVSLGATVSAAVPLMRVAVGPPHPFAWNPHTEAIGRALEQDGLRLMTEVSNATRRGIREYLIANITAGQNPRTLIPELAGRVVDGKRVGGVLGLTAQQARAVANYRLGLERAQFARSDNTDVLSRALRDARWDGAVKRAMHSSTPLDPKMIDRMVDRYSARMLAYRAETIARTESLRAMQVAQQLVWEQAVKRGAVDANRTTKTWMTCRDERVRHEHAAMHLKTIPFNAYFDTEDTGRIWAPPRAVNCRCLPMFQTDLEGAAYDIMTRAEMED